MGKGLSFFWVVMALVVGARPLEAQFPYAGDHAYRAILSTACSGLARFAALLVPSKIPLLADGGGDGGGGGGDGGGGGGDGGGGSGDGAGGSGDSAGSDGSSSDGSGTGDGTGDAGATDAAAAAAADAAAAAAAATTTTDNAAVDAPSTDPSTVDAPTTDPTDAIAPPTDPTTPTVTPELSAIEDIATTDPRGGETPSAALLTGAAALLGPRVAAGPILPIGTGGPVPGGPVPPGSGVDVAINAVIVSAAQSPWDAIKKAPGVRNVIVTGGIVALGKTPIPGEIPGGLVALASHNANAGSAVAMEPRHGNLATAYGGPVQREEQRALARARRLYGANGRIIASTELR